jgi:small subunit ribosomal protein S2
LTNNQTIRGSIKRMKQLQVVSNKNGGVLSVHKQENSVLRRELAKLEKNLTGIAEMNEQPGAVFIVDVIREANAVKEAVRLGIPVVAITDTNADPDPIDYVIPGNDDSVRGIEMIVNKLAEVIKTADAEYSAKAAEERKMRDEENKKRESEQKAARASRKEAAKKGDKPARKPAKAAGSVDIKVKKAAKEAKEAAEAKAKAAQQAAVEAPAEAAAEEAK